LRDAVNAGRATAAAPSRRGRKRRGTVVGLSVLAVVLAGTLVVALGAQAIVSRESCASNRVVVTVGVSDDIAPAVRHVGQYFNAQQRKVAGHCAVVRVTSEQSATVAAQVSGQKPAGGRPVDAWIPDSSLWVDVARSSPIGAQLVQPTGITVARSPLMIVMPRSVAAQMPAFGTQVGWQFLLPETVGGPASALGLRVEFPDPAQSSAGLATLIELQRMLGTGSAALGNFTKFVFNVQVTGAFESGTALASLVSLARPPRYGRPVTVTSEQAVVQFDKSHPDQPLSGRYPSQGSYQLDYPYVLTTSDPLRLRAAQAFQDALSSSYAQSYVRYEGFRSANGVASGWVSRYGLITGQPNLAEPAPPGQAETALQAWSRLALGSRDLALLDVSEQMATPVTPSGTTLEQVLSQVAGLGLSQFPNSTQMGVWAFASHLSGTLPYKKLISVGPVLGEFGLVTRRQQIQQMTQAGTPVAGAPAALYGSILAGYKEMTATYQPRYANAVLVMTAGVDNAPGDISAATLIKDLRKLYNPNRRVEIITLVLGSPVGFAALQQISAATGGQAYLITKPTQVTSVFFNAIARRICSPGCGN
jgi:Bacterial extracellular solute-binding protein